MTQTIFQEQTTKIHQWFDSLKPGQFDRMPETAKAHITSMHDVIRHLASTIDHLRQDITRMGKLDPKAPVVVSDGEHTELYLPWYTQVMFRLGDETITVQLNDDPISPHVRVFGSRTISVHPRAGNSVHVKVEQLP